MVRFLSHLDLKRAHAFQGAVEVCSQTCQEAQSISWLCDLTPCYSHDLQFLGHNGYVMLWVCYGWLLAYTYSQASLLKQTK